MSRLKRFLPPLAGILLILAVWYGICRMELFSAYVLPPPGKVLDSFRKMWLSGEIFEDVAISMARVFRGFFIAFVLAFILGRGRCCRRRGRTLSIWCSFSGMCPL